MRKYKNRKSIRNNKRVKKRAIMRKSNRDNKIVVGIMKRFFVWLFSIVWHLFWLLYLASYSITNFKTGEYKLSFLLLYGIVTGMLKFCINFALESSEEFVPKDKDNKISKLLVKLDKSKLSRFLRNFNNSTGNYIKDFNVFLIKSVILVAISTVLAFTDKRTNTWFNLGQIALVYCTSWILFDEIFSYIAKIDKKYKFKE